MEIVEIVRHSKSELLEKVRNVGLMGHPKIKPYMDATIELVMFNPGSIVPAQRYVLTSEFEKVRDLKWTLEKEFDVDLFNLNGYVSIRLKDSDDWIDVLPPVVELSNEACGQSQILNDGMHRVFLAKTCRENIQCIFVNGVDPKYPYYAYPLHDGWNGVTLVTDIVKGVLKKFHRFPNYKDFYRDFNTVFQNVGGPRGFTK